jgi:hypothetical protein
MRGVSSQYYFFTENCSYQLLALLEVAKPELDLTRAFRVYRPLPHTLPLDSIRALNAILERPTYRPSLALQLKSHLQALKVQGHEAWVLDYVQQKASLDDPRLQAAPAEWQAKMLEAAHDLLYFRTREGDSTGREAKVARGRKLLIARSRLGEQAAFADLPEPRTAPDQAHHSHRWGAGWQWLDQDLAQSSHQNGLLLGGEIEFLNLNVGLADGKPHLLDSRLLAIHAVAPWTRTFPAWSWQASLGSERRLNHTAYFTEGGGGMAVAPHPSWLLHGMLTARAQLDPSRLWAGVQLGSTWQRDRFSVSGEWRGRSTGQRHEQDGHLGLQWHFARDTANHQGLRGSWNRFERQESGVRSRENRYQVQWFYYFGP